jgi:hypothetical protein
MPMKVPDAWNAYQETQVLQCRSRSRHQARARAHQGPQGRQADRHRPSETASDLLPGAPCSRTDDECPGEPEAEGAEAEEDGSKTVESDDGYAVGEEVRTCGMA